MFQVTSTPNAPAAIGPYSQGITANGFLFASGQVPLMPGSGEVVGTTIEGLTFEDVVKTTCFLADMGDFGAFNAVYEKYFVSKPARSCVAVRELPKKVLCEVEIIAAFPEK